MMEWISVKDKKPHDDQSVFCFKNGATAAIPVICYYEEESDSFIAMFTFQELPIEVDYWMAMPKPPKDDFYGAFLKNCKKSITLRRYEKM